MKWPKTRITTAKDARRIHRKPLHVHVATTTNRITATVLVTSLQVVYFRRAHLYYKSNVSSI